MLISLFLVASLLLLGWLAFGAIYQFTGAVSGWFYSKKQLVEVSSDEVLPTIRVFIPAYREDVVIGHTVRQVMASAYPTDRFEVLVIADGLRPATVENLRTLGAHVLEVQFPKSTKSKALNAALAATADRPCDIAVVLDADNATAPDFLLRTARHFMQGTQALQGRRAHKPSQSALALLDAASEDANNHILCRGARALGFSARLAGSGMAFEYGLFSATMTHIDALGGFDKALEGALVQQGVCIEYDEQAVVFDEKVSRSADFSRQRGRWIAAQFRYCRQFLPAATWGLIRHGNIDFFHKALQMMLPPRLLAPGLLAVGTLVSGSLESPVALIWTLALVLNVAAFALALPGWLFQRQHLAVWLHLPKAFLASLTALFHVPQANRAFIVTPKRIVIVDITGN